MRRFATGLVAALVLVLGLSANQALGQARPPYTNPVVSPYLNLNRAGSSAAINYYGIVRPEIDFRNSIQQLQQRVTTAQETANEQAAGGLPTTGHPVYFMNHTTYFMNLGGPGQSMRRPGTSTMATRPTTPTTPTTPARPTGGR